MARRKEKTPEYFTVEVERLDQEGRGVGHHDGKVVFIEGALPPQVRPRSRQLRRLRHAAP